MRGHPQPDHAQIRVAEAKALQAAKLAQYQTEARLRWEKEAGSRPIPIPGGRRVATPTYESRQFRAYRRYRAELQRPDAPSSPMRSTASLPQPQLVCFDDGSTRRTRHDVSLRGSGCVLPCEKKLTK